MKFKATFLTDLMRQNNETAYRLSKTIGVSQTTIKNWVKGSNSPQLAKLGALANHYGVPQESFLE